MIKTIQSAHHCDFLMHFVHLVGFKLLNYKTIFLTLPGNATSRQGFFMRFYLRIYFPFY
jgi:hypothetical protein